MTTTPAAVPDRLERVLFPVLWLVVVVLVALGSAGLVGWLDNPPAGPGRPELTSSGDTAIRGSLDSAAARLSAIADQVERLGVLGRGSLAALTAADFDTLDAAIADGTVVVTGIRDAGTALRAVLLALPVSGSDARWQYSAATLDRHARLVAAVDATNGLATSWARLAQGSLSAGRLTGLLDAHDQAIVSAIDAGLQSNWSIALERIDDATALLIDADALRVELQNTVDVATLSEWIRRNRDYDVALRRLYVVSAESPTRVTPEIREALAAEKVARDALPRNTSNLVIILAEIARGGLNQAVIGIEEARARLAAAIADLGEPSPAP
ncbi:MAG TPA: hypothetical protein VGQ58_01485 [Candidatus Limnocylindrales bacterium]|jgi:hypothetical protein|nr:hypothetical protein [Candidatus Limnocylindrales bacterium]